MTREELLLSISQKKKPTQDYSRDDIINALAAKKGGIKADKRSWISKAFDSAKYQGVKALDNGALETAGAVAGGLAGGLAGAGAGGIGAGPAGVLGSGLGGAAGKNIEDIILAKIGYKPTKTIPEQFKDTGNAALRGAASELLGLGAGKILTSSGKVLADKIAPRVMSSAVKDTELAAEMLKRKDYGTTSGLLKKAEKDIGLNANSLNEILKNTKNPVDRLVIIDELSSLQKEYAKLPGRENEVAFIKDLQKKIFMKPDKKILADGGTDYTKLSALKGNDLKKAIYAENKKLYKSGNFDPASMRAQTDMAIARGLKNSIENSVPAAKGLNKEIGYNINLRDAMEVLLDKKSKSNLMQLRPMLAGLGMVTQGPAQAALAAAPFAAGTGPKTGAAVLMKTLGEILKGNTSIPLGSRVLSNQIMTNVSED